MFKNQPYSVAVRQRGTFYPHEMTYGTSLKFPEKPKEVKLKAKYGPMKIGDAAHTGYNKTFGGSNKSTEYRYVEEREQDPVKYQKDIRNPVWHGTA